jgi:sarcosine oxidase subunit alpha
MGVCFDCLVTVDGKQNQQGCLVPVREGMRVTIQHGERLLSPEGRGEAGEN